jgi:hypothetical protein
MGIRMEDMIKAKDTVHRDGRRGRNGGDEARPQA